jgi:hypothetical protein
MKHPHGLPPLSLSPLLMIIPNTTALPAGGAVFFCAKENR